jgi:hypothetical protein
MDEKTLVTIVTSLVTALLTVAGAFALAERRIRREYRLKFQAQTIAHSLLSHPKWRLRTFATLKHHMGGFDDDALRQILIEAGAVRFYDQAGVEVWGLLKRNRDLIDREWGTKAN